MKQRAWQKLAEIAKINTPWLTVVGERLKTETNQELEYWRVEKPDGLLVLVVQHNQLLLPKPMYRPGVGAYTLDFCGGRVPDGLSKKQAAITILQRELHLAEPPKLISLKPINQSAWNLDSSFSNVQIYGYVAELDGSVNIDDKVLAGRYHVDEKGMHKLLDELVCMQCRAMLREWLAIK